MKQRGAEKLICQIFGWICLVPLCWALPAVLAYQNEAQSPVQNLFLNVQRSMADEEWEKAESDLREALTLVLVQLGAVLEQGGQDTFAKTAFEQAAGASVTTDRALVALIGFYIRTARYAEGLEAVEKLLEINPIHPGGRHFLGKLQIMTGSAEAASHALRDAYLAAPGRDDIGFSLAYSYLRRGDLDNAVKTIEELLKDDPPAELYLKMGRAYLENAYPEQALQQFRRAVDLRPGEQRGRYWMGRTLSDLGRADEAKEYLTAEPAVAGEYSVLVEDQFLESSVSPSSVPSSVELLRRSAAFAYGKLAEVDIQVGRLERAVNHLDQAVAWDEDLEGVHLLKGLALFRQGSILRSVDPALQAVKRQPENPEALRLLTRVAIRLAESKELARAIECTEYLLGIQPESAFLWVLRGRIHAEQTEFDAALSDFSTAVAKDPLVPEAHYNSGILKLATGDARAAIEEFDREIALDPNHDMATFKKAVALQQLGREDEAFELAREIVRQHPRNAEAYVFLAKIQLSRGQLLPALANLETAVSLQPEDPTVYLELSRAYAKAGREHDADQALSRHRELTEKR